MKYRQPLSEDLITAHKTRTEPMFTLTEIVVSSHGTRHSWIQRNRDRGNYFPAANQDAPTYEGRHSFSSQGHNLGDIGNVDPILNLLTEQDWLPSDEPPRRIMEPFAQGLSRAPNHSTVYTTVSSIRVTPSPASDSVRSRASQRADTGNSRKLAVVFRTLTRAAVIRGRTLRRNHCPLAIFPR